MDEDTKSLIFIGILFILLVTGLIFFQIWKVNSLYGGDSRCYFAECRINK